MSDEVTMSATVTEGKMIRNDGPKRDPIVHAHHIETVNQDGKPVKLYGPWPHGESRMVESQLIEEVLQIYNRPNRPMTVLED